MQNFFLEYIYKIINEDIYNEEFVFDLKVINNKLYGALDDLEDSAIKDFSAIAKYHELGDIKDFDISAKDTLIGGHYEISINGIKELKKKMLSSENKKLNYGAHSIQDEPFAINNNSAEFSVKSEDIDKLSKGINRLVNFFEKQDFITLTEFNGNFGNQVLLNYDYNDDSDKTNLFWKKMKKNGFLLMKKNKFIKLIDQIKLTKMEKQKILKNETLSSLKDEDRIVFKIKKINKDEMRKIFEKIIKVPITSLKLIKRKISFVTPIIKK